MKFENYQARQCSIAYLENHDVDEESTNLDDFKQCIKENNGKLIRKGKVFNEALKEVPLEETMVYQFDDGSCLVYSKFLEDKSDGFITFKSFEDYDFDFNNYVGNYFVKDE